MTETRKTGEYMVNGRPVSKEEYDKAQAETAAINERFGRTSRAKKDHKDGTQDRKQSSRATWSGYSSDWRVRIGYQKGGYPAVLAPLQETDGMIFPYTPTVIMNHSANYDTLHPVHSNYPFYAYQNSQVDQIVITGEFISQTQADAEYWVAATHFLRASTKMAYGESANAGNPPPLLKLNGYGQFVFKDVPVIMQTFMVDLPADVDYIETTFGGGGKTFVPTKAQVSVTVSPQYSRRKVETFNLEKFVNGDYLKTGGGFI
jgi:hypothetical protein